MVKSIIKEVFIMLLLCIAIVLLLGVIFYKDIPTNRVIPTKEAYVTPNNVKEEIDEQITEIEKTEISYEITDADLSLYKRSSSYKPGKKDPFSLKETSENGNTDSQDKKNEGQKSDTEPEKVDQNSTGTFFNDTGIK